MNDIGKEIVVAAGEKALSEVYKGKVSDTLNLLRVLRFHQKVGTSISFFRPKVLPPTLSAAHYHCRRVYLQVQV